MLKAFFRWLVSPKYFWACSAVLVCASLVCLRPGTSEPVIRLTGLVLQLLGILTVLWGISETRALFGRPSIASVVRQWFAAFPIKRTKHISGTASITLAPLTVRARGYGTHNPADQSLDARVDALEKNVSVVHDRITGLQNQTDQELDKLGNRVRDEQIARGQEDQVTRSMLEATGTGGIHISAIGAVWLLVGVTLSTAGIEISRALG
jgi:hypothetical protein